MESYELLWQNTVNDLSMVLSQASMSTFIQNLSPVDLEGGKIILWCQKTLVAETVEKTYAEKINESLSKVSFGLVNGFSLRVGKNKTEFKANVPEKEESQQEIFKGSKVNENFTFDSYVVGSSNELTYAA
ncbi:MAG: hypothetical protein MJ072_02090, partial [Clostridia bacterium]|nr:hypothetical protein [Clostridia bacterium]